VNSKEHTPVLLQEVISFIKVKKDEKYVDATVGFGGHGLEIVNCGGILLGIDRDRESLKKLKVKSQKSKPQVKSLKLIQADFADIKKIAEENGFGQVSGILFDLGLSSWQLEKSGRGFSYLKDEYLDMRMDAGAQQTAEDILNTSSREELYEIITKFSEEEHSRRIADAICRARPIKTSGQLKKAIENAFKKGRVRASTLARIFQAIRIAVNYELESLNKSLPEAIKLLKPGGRLLVLSFHSLEDRIVKQFYRKCEREKIGKIITKKPIRPNSREIKKNVRARSAKLRVLEKL
jgi:16S rRNA (cytosine1402-N4)-methyltransferase